MTSSASRTSGLRRSSSTRRAAKRVDPGSVGAAAAEHAHERRTDVLGDVDAAQLGGTPALDGRARRLDGYQRTASRPTRASRSTIDTTDRNDELGARLRFEREASFWETQAPRLARLRRAARRARLGIVRGPRPRRGGVVVQDDVGPSAAAGASSRRCAGIARRDSVAAVAAHRRDRDAAAVAAREGQPRALLPAYRTSTSCTSPIAASCAAIPRSSPKRRPTPTSARNRRGAARPLTDAFLEAAYFRNDVDDSIVFLLVSPSLVEPRNTGDATIDGVELSGGFRVFDWVGLLRQLHAPRRDARPRRADPPGRATTRPACASSWGRRRAPVR